MPQEDYVIKKSKASLLYRIVLTALCIPGIIYFCYENVSRDDDWLIIISYFAVLICISLFLTFLHEYRERYYEIVLSTEGIDLRYHGLFSWEMIESFSTIRNTSEHSVRGTFLILHFKEFADFTFEITDLEISRNELVELVLTYCKPLNVYYRGHNIGRGVEKE
jgi:glucan phosphoethanolaminetransferase (alkaline phosphatase superfamily)